MADERYVVVIGGMNMDICGTPHDKVVDKDSNPGVVNLSIGGVGQNIAQNLAHLGVPTYLVTVYGDDSNGNAMEASCASHGIRLDHAARLKDERSSTYLFVTDEHGEMTMAVNDMGICKRITPEFLAERLDFINGAAVCLLDANLEAETMNWIGKHVTAPLFGDTVSTVKAHRFDGIVGTMTALKPNAMEAGTLTGIEVTDIDSAKQAAVKLLETGLKSVFISMGVHGILCADHNGMVAVPAFKTDIVNVNGAGDSGMAAITWSYFDDPDRSLEEMGRIAQAASSIALECVRSVPDITPERIRAKIETGEILAA